MLETEIDALVRELIRLFVASLRDLNRGAHIPQRWRDWLQGDLGPKSKPGIKPNSLVAEREQKWAREMLTHRIALERNTSEIAITAFAESLAEQSSTNRQTFTAQDVFNADRKWQVLAMSEEVWRLLQAHDEANERERLSRNAEISRRLKSGESLDDLLHDPEIPFETFATITEHQQDARKPPAGAPAPRSAHSYDDREQAILKWISNGMTLGVGHDPPPILNLNEASRTRRLPTMTRKRRRSRK
jgi:hypothetical protein